MGRPKLHENGAARQRAYALRRNTELATLRSQLAAKARRARHQDDVYLTRERFVKAGLLLVESVPQTILDPGAGEGIWGTCARHLWPEVTIIGVDLPGVPRPEGYDEWYMGDFHELACELPSVDLVIGNPPYRYAEPFVRLSLSLLAPEGELLFLLRSAFSEGKARARGLFREHEPVEIAVCDERPQFYGEGKGMTAHSFFRWRPGFARSPRPPFAVIDELVSRWPEHPLTRGPIPMGNSAHLSLPAVSFSVWGDVLLDLGPNTRLHPAVRRERVRDYRARAWLAWRQAGSVRIEPPVKVTFVLRRGRTGDVDNAIASCKAILDGLCDQEGREAMLKNDGPRHVASVQACFETDRRWRFLPEVFVTVESGRGVTKGRM
ncbi:MAG TPA: class I SAM-dependent methyltransferase [Gemmatimonadales bacterium]|nr:class I SAM-dependent methyltransferase [Gemmatimonadales bacterium]